MLAFLDYSPIYVSGREDERVCVCVRVAEWYKTTRDLSNLLRGQADDGTHVTRIQEMSAARPPSLSWVLLVWFRASFSWRVSVAVEHRPETD